MKFIIITLIVLFQSCGKIDIDNNNDNASYPLNISTDKIHGLIENEYFEPKSAALIIDSDSYSSRQLHLIFSSENETKYELCNPKRYISKHKQVVIRLPKKLGEISFKKYEDSYASFEDRSQNIYGYSSWSKGGVILNAKSFNEKIISGQVYTANKSKSSFIEGKFKAINCLAETLDKLPTYLDEDKARFTSCLVRVRFDSLSKSKVLYKIININGVGDYHIEHKLRKPFVIDVSNEKICPIYQMQNMFDNDNPNYRKDRILSDTRYLDFSQKIIVI